MREYAVILCSVLLMVMIFFPGCTTQDTIHPGTTPAPADGEYYSPGSNTGVME